MADAVTPWWQAVDEAVESLVAVLTAAAARAGRERPRGGPRTEGRAKSTRRQLAEVVRSHRLAPGVTADRTTIAALFAGHRGLVTDPVLVVAVAQACAIVAGRKLTARETARLRSASARIAKLIARAEAADRAAVPSVPAGLTALPSAPSAPSTPAAPAPPAASPRPTTAAPSPTTPPPPALPAPAPPAASPGPGAASGGPRRPRGRRTPVGATARPRGHGRRHRRRLAAVAAVLIAAAGALVVVPVALSGPSNTCQADGVRTAPLGGRPVPMAPALDFDEVHGSVWRADQHGRTYYWASAGSAADRPASGGASVRWRFDTGDTWHDCAVTFPATARDDVHTAAVATTLAGRPVRLHVCLWRDRPFRQQCTAVGDALPAASPGS
ncbi:hypothetical protein [Dactylosporangium sp. NPDC051484]|uniref:hypothetical protein n=1 Tax=Dactylosporangium sp. NPDC051484 TaxID=3154942 RepID=UPI00344D80B9